jgi:tRNA/tmRNA/rRNA uracil-C5-methylase (TrmA/RlmC/RlmD family)
VQVSGAEVRVGLTSVGLDRDVVDVRRCPAQTPRFVEVLEHVGRTLDGCPATAAGLETVAVSVGATGEALVEAAGTPSARALVAAAVHELARARTVEGPDDPGLTLDNGVVAPVGSWVPANPAAANLMVEWVIETLGRQRHHAFVLDLCCGPGTVTAKLAERYRVVAVDRDHRATRALVDANLPNVTVRAGAVGRILRKLRRELRGPGPTAAVVNPMRLPLGDQLDDLRALGIEQVVYLGPSPVSACRDANRLAQLSGYRLRRYAAVDLHPGTSQVMLALDLALDTAQPRGIR